MISEIEIQDEDPIQPLNSPRRLSPDRKQSPCQEFNRPIFKCSFMMEPLGKGFEVRPFKLERLRTAADEYLCCFVSDFALGRSSLGFGGWSGLSRQKRLRDIGAQRRLVWIEAH